jgi:hypothetical protein
LEKRHGHSPGCVISTPRQTLYFKECYFTKGVPVREIFAYKVLEAMGIGASMQFIIADKTELRDYGGKLYSCHPYYVVSESVECLSGRKGWSHTFYVHLLKHDSVWRRALKDNSCLRGLVELCILEDLLPFNDVFGSGNNYGVLEAQSPSGVGYSIKVVDVMVCSHRSKETSISTCSSYADIWEGFRGKLNSELALYGLLPELDKRFKDHDFLNSLFREAVRFIVDGEPGNGVMGIKEAMDSAEEYVALLREQYPTALRKASRLTQYRIELEAQLKRLVSFF